MSDLRQLDIITVDDLFIKEGYVLNFSDRTYSAFFREEIGANIDDPKFSIEGRSKGKRLRYFLRTVDNALAVKALKALWEYRELLRVRNKEEEKIGNARARFDALLERLGEKPAFVAEKSEMVETTKYDSQVYRALQDNLIELGKLNSHPRGYAFEKYLKEVFDIFKLEARAPFRLVGEQIDGSFVVNHETYLLEAKWQNQLTGSAELHAFHGKLEQKAAWARGLFISYTGFSEVGLQAFGRGKRVVCLDGADLAEAFAREISLSEVLQRKVRRAAETGAALVRVRDLF
ncbi:MAG: restriction endonuclease [Pseudomonadota bacterium]